MSLVDKIHDASREQALVMGILNVTPDSFSDGGQFNLTQAWQKQVVAMVEAGVDIIDVGGESTRPGALTVDLQQELDRTQPVVEWIKQRFETFVSIDTYKTEVMQASVTLGVDMVNDVNALQSEGAMDCVAAAHIPVCLMHKQGQFSTMQQAPVYDDVVADVQSFLIERANQSMSHGIEQKNIVIDPGFGFGKTLAHNQKLFESLDRFVEQPFPVLVGVSNKRMIGQLLTDVKGERSVEGRLFGSLGAAVLAQMKGASIIRVHDFQATLDALKVVCALV